MEGDKFKTKVTVFNYWFHAMSRLSRKQKARPTKLTNRNERCHPLSLEQACIHVGNTQKQPLTLER